MYPVLKEHFTAFLDANASISTIEECCCTSQNKNFNSPITSCKPDEQENICTLEKTNCVCENTLTAIEANEELHLKKVDQILLTNVVCVKAIVQDGGEIEYKDASGNITVKLELINAEKQLEEQQQLQKAGFCKRQVDDNIQQLKFACVTGISIYKENGRLIEFRDELANLMVQLKLLDQEAVDRCACELSIHTLQNEATNNSCFCNESFMKADSDGQQSNCELETNSIHMVESTDESDNNVSALEPAEASDKAQTPNSVHTVEPADETDNNISTLEPAKASEKAQTPKKQSQPNKNVNKDIDMAERAYSIERASKPTIALKKRAVKPARNCGMTSIEARFPECMQCKDVDIKRSKPNCWRNFNTRPLSEKTKKILNALDLANICFPKAVHIEERILSMSRRPATAAPETETETETKDRVQQRVQSKLRYPTSNANAISGGLSLSRDKKEKSSLDAGTNVRSNKLPAEKTGKTYTYGKAISSDETGMNDKIPEKSKSISAERKRATLQDNAAGSRVTTHKFERLSYKRSISAAENSNKNNHRFVSRATSTTEISTGVVPDPKARLIPSTVRAAASDKTAAVKAANFASSRAASKPTNFAGSRATNKPTTVHKTARNDKPIDNAAQGKATKSDKLGNRATSTHLSNKNAREPAQGKATNSNKLENKATNNSSSKPKTSFSDKTSRAVTKNAISNAANATLSDKAAGVKVKKIAKLASITSINSQASLRSASQRTASSDKTARGKENNKTATGKKANLKNDEVAISKEDQFHARKASPTEYSNFTAKLTRVATISTSIKRRASPSDKTDRRRTGRSKTPMAQGTSSTWKALQVKNVCCSSGTVKRTIAIPNSDDEKHVSIAATASDETAKGTAVSRATNKAQTDKKASWSVEAAGRANASAKARAHGARTSSTSYMPRTSSSDESLRDRAAKSHKANSAAGRAINRKKLLTAARSTAISRQREVMSDKAARGARTGSTSDMPRTTSSDESVRDTAGKSHKIVRRTENNKAPDKKTSLNVEEERAVVASKNKNLYHKKNATAVNSSSSDIAAESKTIHSKNDKISKSSRKASSDKVARDAEKNSDTRTTNKSSSVKASESRATTDMAHGSDKRSHKKSPNRSDSSKKKPNELLDQLALQNIAQIKIFTKDGKSLEFNDEAGQLHVKLDLTHSEVQLSKQVLLQQKSTEKEIATIKHEP